MKRQLIEGRRFDSHKFKRPGQKEVVLEDSNTGDGKFAKQTDVAGLDSMYVSTGRTTKLAIQFEFARIDIGLCVHYSKDKDVEGIDRAMTIAVEELVKAEHALVVGEDYGFSIPLSVSDILDKQCVSRYIMIAYGLTLKGEKKFDSNRLDNSWKYQIDDDKSILSAYDEIRDKLGFRLDQRRQELQG